LSASDHHIKALGCEGQLELNDDPLRPKLGEGEHVRHLLQGITPRVHLTLASVVTLFDRECLINLVCEPI
jgi:hypothetical protein